LLHSPLLKCRRPRRAIPIPEQIGPCASSTIQARHVILPHISSRPNRWTTLTLHLVGGHFALIHRASRSPPVSAAAFVEAVLNLEVAAQTCTFSEAVPPVWDLDALYFRHSDEQAYCERLRRLKVDPSLTSVSLDLVCLDSPSVPFRCSHPQHRIEVNRSRFPGTGDLMDPSGSDIFLDSAWRLRTEMLEGGTGEPGRMLGEIKKEHRDARNITFW
jgi:hypothetical protein